PDDWTGVAGKIADAFNELIRTNKRMTHELERIRRVVGKEGRITQRASLGDVSDSWARAIGSINDLIGDMVHQTSEVARVIGAVTTAVANGDLTKKITVDVRGEFLELKDTVNTMVDQLRSFASEVTRVAREVGSEGILGGQARVEGVSGTWKDLTDSVNFMA